MGFDMRPGGRWIVRLALITAACNIVACLAAEMSARDAWREHTMAALASEAGDASDSARSGSGRRETLAQFRTRPR